MYHDFCSELATASAEALVPPPALSNEEVKAEQLRRQSRNAEHPRAMFQTGEFVGKYSTFDDRGVPLTNAEGQPLSKAASKKLEKLFKGRMQKFGKAQAKAAQEGISSSIEQPATDGSPPEGVVEPTPAEKTDNSMPNVDQPRFICGVFGNRQGFLCECRADRALP